MQITGYDSKGALGLFFSLQYITFTHRSIGLAS